jgi:hypothetical protein
LITIVSGVPRSGTSLMMQMLAAGGMPVLSDHLRPADGNNPRGYFEWEPAKRLLQKPAAILQADGKAVKAISSLLFALPPQYTYRIIFMRRPLAEVERSQAAMIEKLGSKGASLGAEAIISALTAHLKQVEAWLSQRKSIETCPVEYHNLLADPTAEALRIAKFLERPLNIEDMVGQVDPTLYRQREKQRAGPAFLLSPQESSARGATNRRESGQIRLLDDSRETCF